MTRWYERPFVSFDTETTGVDPETARIVTAAVVTVDPVTGAKDVREWLSDVDGEEIPASATEIHGITTAHAREHGEPAADVVWAIASTLTRAWLMVQPVIVYNAPFDLTLLDREMRRHGVGPLDPAAVVDPLVIDRKVQPRKMKGGHQLGTACGIYGIDLATIDAHGAAADALATARLAWILAKRHPDIGAMRLPELHARQIEWHAEQAAELETYLRGVKLRYEGQEAADAVHCPREWPLRPVTVPEPVGGES